MDKIHNPFSCQQGKSALSFGCIPIRKCKTCSHEFYAKPNWIRRGWGRYCSANCLHQSQKTGRIVRCFLCGKDIYRTRKDLRKSKSKKYFCGKSCQTIWRNTMVFIGPRHANWTGGQSTYKNVLLRSSVSRICRRCKTRDYRILTVHHIDKNRKNNHLRNLIWLCHNCHFLIHHYNKERERFVVPIA